MSSRQAVVLASRVLCVFFVYSAISTFIWIPRYTMATIHYWHELSEDVTTHARSYDLNLVRLEAYSGAGEVLRMAIEAALALTFYRGGDGIAEFLLGKSKEETASDCGEVDTA
jgi:hypothetical protein